MIPQVQELNPFIRNLLDRAAQANHRRAVVLAGDADWCHARACEAATLWETSQTLWISGRRTADGRRFDAFHAQRYLGMEFQAVVFDVHSGFDPDLFAALCGTIKGGGLLLLLAPPLADWERLDDPNKSRVAIWPYEAKDIGGRFLAWFARALGSDENVVIVEQHGPLPEKLASAFPADRSHGDAWLPCRTEDQHHAVQAVVQLASGHARRPLVITSDRGRGKSAALGIAAAHLLQQGHTTIITTAPRLAAVAPVFACAGALLSNQELPGCRQTTGGLEYRGASMRFVPPDELLRGEHACNLLMVDEAAAIAVGILEELLGRYSRVVFATTVHGYEGTGRGFLLRFSAVLNRVTPQWRSLSLQTPIRFAAHDPLEALVFDALLLNAEPAADQTAREATPAGCRFEELDRHALPQDPRSLSQLFALLVLAHYQTQPADLRYLLDARELRIYVLRYQEEIVAAALLEPEGVIEADLARAIYLNQRRLRGHLLAQSLATYVGFEDAPRLRYQRVMRIAVHPLAQQRGLGGRLLREIEAALPAGVDLWGASFGASPELLRFWRGAGFAAVHIGMSRNAASGMHAALVLKALSARGADLLRRALSKFSARFPLMLADAYRDLEPPLVVQLLSAIRHDECILTVEDWRDVDSFTLGLRDYEVNAVPLWKLACRGLSDPDCAGVLSAAEAALVIVKVLQQKSWPETVRACRLRGRGQGLADLRSAFSKISACRRSDVRQQY